MEPVYKFIKGKGWVAEVKPEPRPFPWGRLDEICLTCGFKAAYHRHDIQTCPDKNESFHGYQEGMTWS